MDSGIDSDLIKADTINVLSKSLVLMLSGSFYSIAEITNAINRIAKTIAVSSKEEAE